MTINHSNNQTPNNNHQTITNGPNTNHQTRCGYWSIGYWLLFGVCYLVIGDSLLVVQAADSGPREMQRDRMTAVEWDRDPFARSPAAQSAGALTLSGILWDAQAPIAIVNGQMLRAGEEVGGFRVVEIRQDRVIVTDGTQTLQLSTAP